MSSVKRMYVGRRSSGRPSKKAKTLGAKVSRLQRQVALLKPEVKEIFTTASTSNVTQAAGLVQYVSDVIQGTAESNRIGDTIRCTEIEVRGFISDTANVTTARLMLVKDNDSNGVIPSISGTAQSILTSFSARQTYPANQTSKRFTIIYNEVWNGVNATLGTGNGGMIQSGPIMLRGVSTFSSSAGTNADAGKNQYYLVLLVDGADTADINAVVRLRYTDV